MTTAKGRSAPEGQHETHCVAGGRELQTGYRKMRWPVVGDPKPDELLSRGRQRLAIANGLAPRSFAGVPGLGDRMWSPASTFG
ncbi:hypothetical protein X750_28625 [Mesorhizobium sp. LNJC394B00]|nr:hypothetical protein X750_28625 [Mesorhizobium sp. LNJC394B00]